ncbi:MAG: family 1 glycosylhydrolase [Aggregatilineales bacterium]
MTVKQYHMSDFDIDLSGFELPDSFLFGVCNSPYHSEGNYNTDSGPHNNWSQWENDGHTERSGETNRFWDNYLPHIRKAAETGLNAFRMGIDWARLQPSSSPYEASEPQWDETAFDRYAEIIGAVYDHEMMPIITLHHFTHPAWLGDHVWTDDEKVKKFLVYVSNVVEKVNSRLVDNGYPAIPFYVVFNEPFNTLAGPYLFGDAPPGGIKNDAEAFSIATVNLLTAYVKAYDLIHAAYEQHRWQSPKVGFNIVSYCLYELDKWYLDIIRARSLNLERDAIENYLNENKQSFYKTMNALAETRLDAFQRWYWEKSRFDYAALFSDFDLTKLLDAIYESPNPQKLDYVAIDCYDPFIFSRVSMEDLYPFNPPKSIAEERFNWEKLLFDATVTREHLIMHASNLSGLPLYILETNTGMNHPLNGDPQPRSDGMTRPMFLRDILIEVIKLIQQDVPLQGFLYWTLCDNYEWGTHTSRLGLVEYDYENNVIKETDAFGFPMLRIYHDFIKALRSGDQELIRATFENKGAFTVTT